MALEDKRSQLQPNSTQAQQYRLQYSNLQGRANEAIKYNQPSALVPGVSQFVGGPTPVALAAPVAQTPAAVEVAKVYKTKAAVLDGSTYFTSSIGDVDLNVVSSGSLSFVFMIKPDVLPTREKQYLLHTYTGSFASHSLEVTLLGTKFEMRATNGGKYVRYYTDIPKSAFGAQDNGYTLVEVYKTGQYKNVPSGPFDYASFGVRVGNTVRGMYRAGSGAVTSLDLSQADHLSIGGTAAATGANFSGSIAFAMIKGTSYLTNQQYLDLKDSKKTPGSIIPQVRVYTFDSTGAVEDPGTEADINVTLGVAGSYSSTTGYY